jgi:lysophospholipase L1-like esterase
MNTTMKIKLSLILIVLLAFAAGCAKPRFADINNVHTGIGENLVCFGNSLTVGIGAEKDKDFPTILAQKLKLPVIKAGHSGDTTFNALERVDDVVQMKPKIVIVEFGANDFLLSFRSGIGGAGESHVKAFENLKIIVNKLQNAGAVVIIAGIALNDNYRDGYRKLAKETHSILIPDILEGIRDNQNLMSADNRHPNSLGYQKMSEKFLDVLEPLLIEIEK